jgi:hypothetical protein
VIAMLQRPEGATVDEVASAMGWRRHTVRGLFSENPEEETRLTVASVQPPGRFSEGYLLRRMHVRGPLAEPCRSGPCCSLCAR